ncbi:hypothetical protein O3M35_000498 [Rhynocoris fuscipes]|uniref:Uncharacterized protein n=1 Tax=Rhynocoris fuscipes TaxID=488301 RepID=A0AAW1DLQ8_9HEMI
MNKVAEIKNRESVWISEIVPLFSREQVDNSVQLLVACGEILRSPIRADHRQWLDISARALIADKLSTVYESHLGKSNTSYGKAKLWAELAARWMVSGNDTTIHMYTARQAILQLLRAHPPSHEIILKSFQTTYNRVRKNVKKGNVSIDKLAPFVSPLPSCQSQVTVQAFKFATASAHAIKWSDFLVLTDEVKRQLDIIKSMPNVVILFNKLTLQLREDWQQQWVDAESNQILAVYEMICKACPVEESNRYVEALVGVSYSLCKGPNIMDKWLQARLRRIQKKLPNFKIKDCVSIADINTFTSAYIKSEIPIDDVYKFLTCIYLSLNRAARKVVNLVMEQVAVQNYWHAINFGALNVKTNYSSLSVLIKKVPRVQWTKIAQIAVDLQRDPCHAVLKARTPVKEFIDLANFGKIGTSLLHEKFDSNFQGFIHDGALSKEEILDLVIKAVFPTCEESDEVLSFEGTLLAPTLANFHFLFIEDRLFTHSSTNNTNNAIASQQDETKVLINKKNEINDIPEEISLSVEEEGENQCKINSAVNLSQKALIYQQDELIDVLEQCRMQLEGGIQQRSVSANNAQQDVDLAQQDELKEARRRMNEDHEQDIQQRKISTLINLQKEVQLTQQYEQKDVLEQFNKHQDVLQQRFKKISISWQKEIRKTQQEEGIPPLNFNSKITLQPEVQMAQQDVSQQDAPDQFNNQQEERSQQRNTNPVVCLPQNAHTTQLHKPPVILEQFGDKQKELKVPQYTVREAFVAEDKIVIGRDDLPEAAKKFPNIDIEIKKNQLPELYGRAMAVIQDIKSARVICKYLNIVGKRSVFHPFVKKDKMRFIASRFRPVPAELRDAAATFGLKIPDNPVEDSLNDSLSNELSKAPRPTIKEISFDVEQPTVEKADVLSNNEKDEPIYIFDDLDENELNDGSVNELTTTPSPRIKDISSDVEQSTEDDVNVFDDPDGDNADDSSVNELTKTPNPRNEDCMNCGSVNELTKSPSPRIKGISEDEFSDKEKDEHI